MRYRLVESETGLFYCQIRFRSFPFWLYMTRGAMTGWEYFVATLVQSRYGYDSKEAAIDRIKNEEARRRRKKRSNTIKRFHSIRIEDK